MSPTHIEYHTRSSVSLWASLTPTLSLPFLGNDSASIFAPELLPCGQIPIPVISKSTPYVASLSLLMQLVMLATALLIGHALRRFKILIVHEAGAALGLGVLVGLLVNFLQHASEFR